jgi:hypothetical protein
MSRERPIPSFAPSGRSGHGNELGREKIRPRGSHRMKEFHRGSPGAAASRRVERIAPDRRRSGIGIGFTGREEEE